MVIFMSDAMYQPAFHPSTQSGVTKYGYAEVKSKHLKMWKKRWMVLYTGSVSGPTRLVKYKDEKCAKDNKYRAEYFLSDVSSVRRLPKETRDRAVEITFRDDVVVQFSCESEADADDWVATLNKHGTITGSALFPVCLLPNSILSHDGELTMEIEKETVSLIDSETNHCVVSWQITAIRRYKEETNETFWIESGRRSETGEGIFTFTSPYAHRILLKIDEAARNLHTAQISQASVVSSQPSPRPLPPVNHHGVLPPLPHHPTNSDYITACHDP